MNIKINFLLTEHCTGEIIGLAGSRESAIQMVKVFKFENSLEDDGQTTDMMIKCFEKTGGHNGDMQCTFIPLLDKSEHEGNQKTAIKITTMVVK